MTYEEATARLEQIIDTLSRGSVSLDESLKLYGEGVKLAHFCDAKLTEVEQKISVISEGGEISFDTGDKDD